jgi:NAD(P)-dependent dehydrogenase (short-subunit alcohol dehydrogenase family)
LLILRGIGAGRGIGLALARGAAELGSDIAVLDTLESPHADFAELEHDFGVKVKYYRCVSVLFGAIEADNSQD